MFSSAFKSFTSNITSNYEVSRQPSTTIGVWTIFKARKKTAPNTEASVFVFDRKSLEISTNGFASRSTSATSLRKSQDEVVERLKKEASSLARLRHPSVLQLVEPVEETRNGGLMYATEPIVCSLSTALAQLDRKVPSNGDRRARYTSAADASASESEDLELDELEIQKGLLQIAKGLEFLHDSAKLVHGNLNTDAIIINSKSDWKISGLSFAGPPDGAEGHQAIPQISLSEVLYHDPRIPRTVQLDLDYASPDFVLDSNINSSADIFSLGLVILACYREPHRSPIETHGNQSTYKKAFSNSSTVPTSSNDYLCGRKLPLELNATLPRILTRRPAQRMTASEFQQSQYFDNILVNTIRFLDALPAKSASEKIQFMQGLGRVMPQFPSSILGKKILSVLLEEMKDRDLLPLIMQNIFHVIKIIPTSKQVVSEKILPRMREIFMTKSKSEEKDSSKEAALLAVLSNIQLVADNTTSKQFKDDLLPIIHTAMESSTHAITDASLQTLPTIMPLLDFSTVKNDLFPVIAGVFSKTNSLSIKVRGLEALGVLCGVSGKRSGSVHDEFTGKAESDVKPKGVSSLDKFTMQEKIVPLLKGIKTKEPAVMMAALKVFRQIGLVVDIEVLAIDILPIMWSFSLGPLLDMSQFQAFMEVIKSLSAKIEQEQIRKLQELSSSRLPDQRANSVQTFVTNATTPGSRVAGTQDDFAKLVLGGRDGNHPKDDMFAGALSDGQRLTQNPPSFSWSNQALQPQPLSRSITPDVTVSSFPSLQPSQQFAAPSPWVGTTPLAPVSNQQQARQPSAFATNTTSAISPPLLTSNIGWSLPPPPRPGAANATAPGSIRAPTQLTNSSAKTWQQTQHNAGPPAQRVGGFGGYGAPNMNVLQPLNPQQQQPPQKKTGLDKYESLL